MQRLLLSIVVLAGCWRGAPPATPTTATVARASPASSASPASQSESYRHITIAFDVVGVGLLSASTVAYARRGGDDPLTGGLVIAGGLSALGTPITHLVNGHGGRAGVSYLFRSMLISAGMIAGAYVGCAREPGFLCGLGPEIGWGMAGGVALAGAFDALLMHRPDTTWTPAITPTDGGAQVGIGRLF